MSTTIKSTPISKFENRSDEASSACFSHDDKMIVTSSLSGICCLFRRDDDETAAGAENYKLVGDAPIYDNHRSPYFNYACFSPDDTFIVLAKVHGPVVIHVESRKFLEISNAIDSRTDENADFSRAVFHPDKKQRLFATSCSDSSIRFFRIVSQEERDEIEKTEQQPKQQEESAAAAVAPYFTEKVEDFPYFVQIDAYPPLTHHTESTYGFAWSNSGNFFVTSSEDKSFAVFDFPSMQMKYHITSAFNSRVSDVAISPDNSLILAVSWDRTAKLFHSEDGSPVLALENNKSSEKSSDNSISPFMIKSSSSIFFHCAFSQGSAMICQHADEPIFFDVSTQKQIDQGRYKHPEHIHVWFAEFSHDNKRIVTCGNESEYIYVWNTQTQEAFLRKKSVFLLKEFGKGKLAEEGMSLYRVFALTCSFL